MLLLLLILFYIRKSIRSSVREYGTSIGQSGSNSVAAGSGNSHHHHLTVGAIGVNTLSGRGMQSGGGGGSNNTSYGGISTGVETEIKPRSLRFTWSMKTTSSMDPNDMMKEIRKVLEANNCDYEQKEKFLLMCIHGDPNADSLVSHSKVFFFFIYSGF